MNDQSQDSFITGQRIDRYEVREHIGQGGMGAVFRAIDTKLGRTVAIKTVVAHRRGNRLTEEIRERFMREALAASRVDHRNVVQVLDFGFADDGTPYIVMEYLRGQSLAAVLKNAKEPLAPDYVADVMLSVCAALRACPSRRDHPPRSQAREHLPVRHRHRLGGQGARLRHLEGAGERPAHTGRSDHRYAAVSFARTDLGERRAGERPVRAGRAAVRVPDRAVAVRELPERPLAARDRGREVRSAAAPASRSGRGAGDDRAARHARLPQQRFESIHALGQRLWAFASPRGQGQWRSFYFHTPAGALPASPPALPEVRPRPDATASLEPAALAKTEMQPSTVGPSAFAATKTRAASAAGEVTRPDPSRHRRRERAQRRPRRDRSQRRGPRRVAGRCAGRRGGHLRRHRGRPATVATSRTAGPSAGERRRPRRRSPRSRLGSCRPRRPPRPRWRRLRRPPRHRWRPRHRRRRSRAPRWWRRNTQPIGVPLRRPTNTASGYRTT